VKENMFKAFVNITPCQKAVTAHREDLQLLQTKQLEFFLYVVQMAFEMSFFNPPELLGLMLINTKQHEILFSVSHEFGRLFSNVEEQNKTLSSLMCYHGMCVKVVRMLQYKKV